LGFKLRVGKTAKKNGQAQERGQSDFVAGNQHQKPYLLNSKQDQCQSLNIY
jgi:hypothetical protein